MRCDVPTGVLTRDELDLGRCDNPMCAHDHSILYMVPGCHGRGLRVTYDKRTGRLTAKCFKCDAQVATIAVARSELVN